MVEATIASAAAVLYKRKSNVRLLSVAVSVYAATKLRQLIPVRPTVVYVPFFQHWNNSILPALFFVNTSELPPIISIVIKYYLAE